MQNELPRPTQTWCGYLLNVVVGAVAGGLAGYIGQVFVPTIDYSTARETILRAQEQMTLYVLIGVVVGSLLGLLWGYLAGRRRTPTGAPAARVDDDETVWPPAPRTPD